MGWTSGLPVPGTSDPTESHPMQAFGEGRNRPVGDLPHQAAALIRRCAQPKRTSRRMVVRIPECSYPGSMISGGHLLGCALFRTIVVLALGLGLTLGARAGSGTRLSAQVGDHTVEVWQIEDGLPQISVTSIAQTPDGYLWLGTFNGLARFDGVRFAVFDEGNTPALGSSRIVRLEVDSDGILWIVTETGGLARLAAGPTTFLG